MLTARDFKSILERAGLPAPYACMTGTPAPPCCSKGMHPKLVQELLGHANVSITLDTYSHVLPGMGDGFADAMDNALS